MKELVRLAVDRALEGGASYADARALTRESEGIEVKNGAVEGAAADTDTGIGVRVIVKGAWGFAATADLDRQSIERAVQLDHFAPALITTVITHHGPPWTLTSATTCAWLLRIM